MKVNIKKLKLLPNLIPDNSILKSHSTSSFQSNCFKETITIEPKNFRGWGSKFSFPEFLDKYVDKVNDYVELVTIKSEFKPEILPKFIGRVNTLDVSNSVKPYGTLAISSTLDKYLSTSGLKVCAGASIVDRSHNLQTILHCCPTVGENESLDSALKRWKRKCQKDGIIGDIRKKEAYLKPGIRKKLKSEAAQKRNRKGN